MRRTMDAADIIIPAHDTRIPLEVPRDWFELPPESQPEPPLLPIAGSTSRPTQGKNA